MVVYRWGRCPYLIASPLPLCSSLAAVLLALSLLFQSAAASAANTPYEATLDFGIYAGPGAKPNGYAYGFSSPAEACQSVSFSNPAVAFSHITLDPIYRYSTGDCFWTFGTTVIHWPRGWDRYATCPKGGYVMVDSHGPAPLCECPPGQDFDPTQRCVQPPPEPKCPIEPLAPYSPDPEPVDITAPNFKLGTQLACMQNAIGASNGTSRVNSGYRSAPYNKHLQQVWDKWREFLDAQRPECAAELATAENHKNAHELVARPADSSAHTRGEAFDLSSGLYDGILDVLGFGCGLRRPDPIGDPPHFIRR